MSSSDVVKETEKVLSLHNGQKNWNIHEACGQLANHLIRECMHRRALDNLTIIIIGLQGLETRFPLASNPVDSRPTSQTRKVEV